jgi:hypothetical protein
MAAVSNVSLSIGDSSTANSKDVTVSGTLTFDTGDVGKNYRLEIKLFGEDAEGDRLPDTDPAGDDELYTFIFWLTSTGWLPRPYKQISVTAAGSQPFTYTRTISSGTLDEDSGNIVVPPSSIGLPPPPPLPRFDEVYAKVTLSVAPSSSSARSKNTVTGIY